MNRKKALDVLFKNKVVILFVILCVGGTIASKQPLTFVIPELFTRIARNSFLVLSLIIPVLAGMGLNFGIVIGAMAAQVAIFLTTYWGFVGIGGFLLTVAIATPIAMFFGFLVGKLFNHMKGAVPAPLSGRYGSSWHLSLFTKRTLTAKGRLSTVCWQQPYMALPIYRLSLRS